ncbi:hypothetical protein U9M48_014870 [Paspalum notatum var. saurae]|uniref:Uncharacterized protein n=1 Tax=Paspalum notatum var. saurae TaxID=547442 RepID=A0AAQ3T5A4_PASNO
MRCPARSGRSPPQTTAGASSCSRPEWSTTGTRPSRCAKAAPVETSKEPAADAGHGGEEVRRRGLFDEVAVFEEGYYCHGYPDWTSSLFDDGDYCYDDEDEDACNDENDDLDLVDDEPSVIEIIKSSRVAQGLEFNMDDEIDEACEMFIRRCRGRMNLSF